MKKNKGKQNKNKEDTTVHIEIIIDGVIYIPEDEPQNVTEVSSKVDVPATHRRKTFIVVEIPELMAEFEQMVSDWCAKHQGQD